MLVQSNLIVDRCLSLALTLARAQQLAKEDDAGDSGSLARVLGLDTETLEPIADRRWIWMAAQGASVSYREGMDERTLVDALTTGRIPSKYFAHMCTLFDEVPLQVVVMACHQVAQLNHIAMERVWKNVEILACLVGAHRATFWSV